VVGRFLDDERLDKPWLTAVLGFVLELGNFPVSSRSVRHHHAPGDLRKRPVGHHPVPLLLGPRAIPKPFHARSHVPIRTGRADDPNTWPAIQVAGYLRALRLRAPGSEAVVLGGRLGGGNHGG